MANSCGSICSPLIDVDTDVDIDGVVDAVSIMLLLFIGLWLVFTAAPFVSNDNDVDVMLANGLLTAPSDNAMIGFGDVGAVVDDDDDVIDDVGATINGGRSSSSFTLSS